MKLNVNGHINVNVNGNINMEEADYNTFRENNIIFNIPFVYDID